MKSKFLILTFPVLIVTLAFFNQCSNTKSIPDVCFTKNILPIFVSKCATSGCHDGGSNSGERLDNFTTYDGIMTQVKPYYPFLSEVYTKCSGKNPEMPPSSSAQLTKAELEYIKYWIHTGAKNSSDCGGKTCDTSNISFNNRIKPILETWCVGCHNPSNAGGGFDLSTYDGVVNSILPDDRLTGSILQLAGYSAMPKGGGSLENCDLKAIQKWIAAGSQNN